MPTQNNYTLFIQIRKLVHSVRVLTRKHTLYQNNEISIKLKKCKMVTINNEQIKFFSISNVHCKKSISPKQLLIRNVVYTIYCLSLSLEIFVLKSITTTKRNFKSFSHKCIRAGYHLIRYVSGSETYRKLLNVSIIEHSKRSTI